MSEPYTLVPTAALRWISSGDTGMSSEAIFAHMTDSSGRYTVCYPSDPSDLGRCLRLLEKVPEWKSRIAEMAQHGPYWAALVARWDELEQSMLDEAGIYWEKARLAQKTYDLMKSILGEVRNG